MRLKNTCEQRNLTMQKSRPLDRNLGEREISHSSCLDWQIFMRKYEIPRNFAWPPLYPWNHPWQKQKGLKVKYFQAFSVPGAGTFWENKGKYKNCKSRYINILQFLNSFYIPFFSYYLEIFVSHLYPEWNLLYLWKIKENNRKNGIQKSAR